METKKIDITYEFLHWADEYFTEDKLNTLLDLHLVFENYQATLNPKLVSHIKVSHFKCNLIRYCVFKGYTFNPDYLKSTVSEKDHNNIKRTVDGIEFIYFYISTERNTNSQNNKIMVQKNMEARLVALGAEYGKKKAAIESQIRILRINREEQFRSHNEIVSQINIKIHQLEDELGKVKMEYHCSRSDIYDCFAVNNPE